MPLCVRAQGCDRMLQAGPRYRIGRDPASDIVISDPRVSWQHAVLWLEGDAWMLEDRGSRNGTFIGADQVRRLTITGDCLVRLGHPEDGPAVSCSPAPASAAPAPGPDGGETTVMPSPAGADAGDGAALAAALPAPGPAPACPLASPRAAAPTLPRPPSVIRSLPATLLRIGRAADNDVVVPDLGVSRHHAQLRKTGSDGYEIADLDSHNGTFLNGQRITLAPVSDGDLIGVGHLHVPADRATSCRNSPAPATSA